MHNYTTLSLERVITLYYNKQPPYYLQRSGKLQTVKKMPTLYINFKHCIDSINTQAIYTFFLSVRIWPIFTQLRCKIRAKFILSDQGNMKERKLHSYRAPLSFVLVCIHMGDLEAFRRTDFFFFLIRVPVK